MMTLRRQSVDLWAYGCSFHIHAALLFLSQETFSYPENIILLSIKVFLSSFSNWFPTECFHTSAWHQRLRGRTSHTFLFRQFERQTRLKQIKDDHAIRQLSPPPGALVCFALKGSLACPFGHDKRKLWVRFKCRDSKSQLHCEAVDICSIQSEYYADLGF